MKIGAKTYVFNFVMREKRAEFGWSQAELAQRCGMPLQFVNAVEALRCPGESISTIVIRLNEIAHVLEVPFDDLFPADYLEAIEQKKLPRRRAPFVWMLEIRINELPPAIEALQIESPEAALIAEDDAEHLPADVLTLLDSLPAIERQVIELRFGIGAQDGQEKTLQEMKPILHMTAERIRTIEARALRKLRHPHLSGRLREYVGIVEDEEAEGNENQPNR